MGKDASNDQESTFPSQIEDALEALRNGKCVAILDDEKREGETDLFFPAALFKPQSLRFLRTQAGGELYIAIGNEVASTFGIPFISQALVAGSDKFPIVQGLQKGEADMCQGTCSVSLSLDHRTTHTGAPDSERSFTCNRLASLWEEAKTENVEEAMKLLWKEFHTPGHIFLCIEHANGLKQRSGHTELSVALARLAGVPPLMVGCVMLCNSGEDYGALSPPNCLKWAQENEIPFIKGADIIKYANSH